MTNNTSRILGIAFLLSLIGVVGIVLMSGCLQNTELQKSESPIPPPPTTPVSQGYIQSFDNNLNYGFEYPETWAMHSPDEFSYTQGVKKVDMFTKPSEGTSIAIIAKTSIWKDTNEAKSVWKEAFNGAITNETDLNVNNLKGYEITRNDSGTKSKMAIFIVDGMAFEFDYTGADNETSFNASEAIFDHVVNSFNVNSLVNSKSTNNTQIANPASVNCVEKGGKLSIVDKPEGQIGMCTLSDGTVCEEWAYFRGECQ